MRPHTWVLPSGHTALVDYDDRGKVLGRPWHAIPARSTFYVQAGDDTNVLLHRLILDAPAGLLVDHVNRNGLDNRRSNLRLATHSQNHANRPAPSNNTSGYKGVSLTRRGRFEAYITVDGRRRSLGSNFRDPWAAAEAYNAAALDAWGEFALLNNTTDPGPVTPSPVPGPVAASPEVNRAGSTNQHPTENREIA